MQPRILRILKTATARAWKHLRSSVATAGHAFSRRPRWVRRTAIALSTLIGLSMAFNAALNLGVSRSLLNSLISVNPESLGVDYRRAWSFWPGLVYVRNVAVRGSDANVQWQVEVDEARVSIDLMALLESELHVTKLRAQGIGFRLRQKLDAEDVTEERLAPLPPIPGFEGPPLSKAGPPPPDIPDEEYDLWSIRIEDVDGNARQIWADELRFEGDVHVRGAFFLQPKRRVWVGPASATFLSGSVTLGDEKLLDGTSGSVDCTIPPFDPRPPVGMEVFRFVSGTVRLDADISSARALDYYTRVRGASTVIDGGKGVFHLDGVLRAGVARPLSLSVDLHAMQAQDAAWLARGSLHVSAQAGSQGPSEWLARIAPLELRHVGAKAAAIHGTELRLSASIDEVDISEPAPDFNIHADLPYAHVPDLRVANMFLSSLGQLRVDGGKASIAAYVDANLGTNRAQGDLVVGTDGMSAHSGELRFEGQLNAKVHVANLDLDNGNLDVSSAVMDTKDVNLRDSDKVVSNWWSHIETHDAKLRPGQRSLVDALWTAKLQNAAPVLAFSKRTPSLPGWITRLLTGGEVDASGRLQAGKAFMVLSD